MRCKQLTNFTTIFPHWKNSISIKSESVIGEKLWKNKEEQKEEEKKTRKIAGKREISVIFVKSESEK